MKISKEYVNQILKSYSCRKGEFVPQKNMPNTFVSKYARSYMITIKPETQYYEETGRITVLHTDSSGVIMFYDTWNIKNGELMFLTRDTKESINKKSDVDYIKELEENIEELKATCRKLNNELQIIKEEKSTIPDRKKKKGRPFTKTSIEDSVMEDYRRGVPKAQIARKYKLERKTIYNIIKRCERK